MDNAKEWTSLPMPELPTMAPCRKDWKRISAESSVMLLARRPSRSRDWTEQNWTSWSSAKKPAALIFAFPIIQLHFSVFSMNKLSTSWIVDQAPTCDLMNCLSLRYDRYCWLGIRHIKQLHVTLIISALASIGLYIVHHLRVVGTKVIAAHELSITFNKSRFSHLCP